MGDTEQPGDSARQAQHDEDIYELRLSVVCNNRKSQLAFENLRGCLKIQTIIYNWIMSNVSFKFRY
jgi:hypothetical protein